MRKPAAPEDLHVPVAAPALPEMTEADPRHRAGFVALLGPPNAGKSTLLNRLVGEPLAIVTRKAQTTRRRILGISRRPGVELMLQDTPGLHQPRSRLGRAMMRSAVETLGGADVALGLVDGSAPAPEGERELVSHLRRFSGPCVVGVNKIDTATATRRRECEERCRALDLGTVILFSARTGENIESPGGLVSLLSSLLPFSPPLYAADRITDLPEAFFAGEIVRERLLVNLRQEVPHAAAVRIDRYDERVRPLRIDASLLLDRDSQKGIVIGRGGAMLKRVGIEARARIERRIGRRVHLQLQVKVRAGWRDNPGILRDLGL